MLDKSKFREHETADNVDVAAAEQINAQKQQTIGEDASEQNEENMKRSGLAESTNTEIPSQDEVGADGVDDVEQKVARDGTDDDDATANDDGDRNLADGETDIEPCREVAENAETKPLLSETEKEEGTVEHKAGYIVCSDDTDDKHSIAADIKQRSVETKHQPSQGSSSVNNPATVKPPDVADLASESEHLLSTDGTQSEEQSLGTEVQDRLSQDEKKGGLTTKIGCSDTEIGSTATDATNLEFTGLEDSDKGPSLESEGKEPSKSEDKYEIFGLTKQAERCYDEAVKNEVPVSMDDENPDNENRGTERSRIRKVQSSLGYAKYLSAVNMVKKRLKSTTEKPKNNSVLNSLRFFTREEQLNEYYCLTCNEGLFRVIS